MKKIDFKFNEILWILNQKSLKNQKFKKKKTLNVWKMRFYYEQK